MIKKMIHHKHFKYYVMFVLFVGILIVLLFTLEFKELVRDIAKQVWIFIAMLLVKFGQENIVKHIVVAEALSEDVDPQDSDTSTKDS